MIGFRSRAYLIGKHANGQICLVFCPQGDTTVAVAHLLRQGVRGGGGRFFK